jgi:hypothetical protein
VSSPSLTLTGALPFPRLQDWRGDGALFAYQNLLARRESDPSDLGIVAQIAKLDRLSWERTLLQPTVFAFIANQPRPWSWPELQDGLSRGLGHVDAGGISLASRPGSMFKELLRGLGKGSRGASCETAAFLEPDSIEFAWARESIAAAMQLLVECAPGYAADLKSVVCCVALVNDKASFRGSSGTIHRGMVLLSPDDGWTPGVFAEELVHEATHNVLDLVSLRQPLVSGLDAFEEIYAAPFRPDKRHVYGNLQALVVVARLICLFASYKGTGVWDERDWDERAFDYATRSLEPLETVSAHPGLSPLSRHLVESFVRPTLLAVAANA